MWLPWEEVKGRKVVDSKDRNIQGFSKQNIELNKGHTKQSHFSEERTRNTNPLTSTTENSPCSLKTTTTFNNINRIKNQTTSPSRSPTHARRSQILYERTPQSIKVNQWC